MRKIILFLLVLVSCMGIGASAAQASSTNLYKYGFGASNGDILLLSAQDIFGAAGMPGHIRVVVDCGRGLPGSVDNNINSKIGDLYNSGITPLYLLTWKINGAQHMPANQTEKDYFQDCAANLAYLDNVITALNGWTSANVYEIWNEPNCHGGGTSRSLSNYMSNIVSPAIGGINSVDPDANVVIGAFGFGSDNGSDYCKDPGSWMTGLSTIYWNWDFQAISAHPYGYTSCSYPWARGSTANQTHAKAQCEVDRVDGSWPVLCTEFGRRVNWAGSPFTQSQQQGYLNAMATDLAGCRLQSNWLLKDQRDSNLSGDQGHEGMIFRGGGHDNVGKLGWQTWLNLPATKVGTL